MAASQASYMSSDEEKIVANSVSLAMQYIFSLDDICRLDIADGLKELLYEKRYDLNFLIQSDAASLSHELGIEEYVAKLIIDAAKKTATK